MKTTIADGFISQAQAAMKRPDRSKVLDNLKSAVEAASLRTRDDGFVTIYTFEDKSEFDIMSALAPIYAPKKAKKKSTS
jgi:hypothetical protein